jgi:hypothetical protein
MHFEGGNMLSILLPQHISQNLLKERCKIDIDVKVGLISLSSGCHGFGSFIGSILQIGKFLQATKW